MMSRPNQYCPAYLLFLLAVITLLSACATHRLQPDTGKKENYALPPAESGALHDFAVQAAQSAAAGDSSFLPLPDNQEALRWRLVLIDLAQESIDVQYYLIDKDESSKLLGLHIIRAAERGVRIRILVDDAFVTGRDQEISAWNRHPNIEIRVFNPWHKRGSLIQQGLELIGYPERLNRRMHNKLSVIDGQIAITGGRNIGNAYFGLSKKYNFRDLEVAVAGPVVRQLTDTFDLYWNDDWTMSAGAFAAGGSRPVPLTDVLLERKRELAASETLLHAGLLAPLPDPAGYLKQFIENTYSGDVWVAFDDPPSGVVAGTGVRKIDQLEDLDSDISQELLIVSPYFIPSDVFLEKLRGLAGRGVRVCVLTNSLASTNHTIVNSGYRPWRRKLLKAGVELYEYRGDPSETTDVLAPGMHGRFVSLHTKTFVIDREIVYIGSLNMDPRSFHLNTEMGLLISAPGLAGEIAELVEQDMGPENAWRVTLNDEEQLVWSSAAGIVHRQPARHPGQRIADFFYGLLPIQDQL